MELNEAIDNINLLITNLENMSIKEIEPENYILLNSLNTVLEELNNRISKEILEEYLTQAEEGYKIYKKASKENEGCKGGMWRYLGQVDVLKRILGKSIKIVTLDKE